MKRLANEQARDSLGNLSDPGGGGVDRAPAPPPIEDITVSLIAKSKVVGPLYGYRPVLSIHCRDKEMLGYVVVGMDAEPDRDGRSGARFTTVTFWRDGEPFQEEMRISQDGDRLYFASSAKFSWKLIGGHELTLSFMPLGGHTTATRFDISSFDETIQSVRKACSW